MPIARGSLGPYPCAAFGHGEPVVVLAGLSPNQGVAGDATVRGAAGPVAHLAGRRRIVVVNRRRGLPRGMTMAELAGEHAAGIRAELGAPVDLVGISTGGSIAQQIAADHPDVVRRLVLISTGCRLGPLAKAEQRQVAARLRAGATRQAFAVMAAAIVPPGRGKLPAAVAAWLAGPLLLRDDGDLDAMATTIEAEDGFDLAALAPIGAPTLILAGGEDRFYPAELLEETRRLIPGSELRLLDGRGHVTVMADRRLREAVAGFL